MYDHVVDPASQMQDSFSLAEFLLGEAVACREVSFCDNDIQEIKQEPKSDYEESLASDDSSRPSPAYSLPYQVPSTFNNSNISNSTPPTTMFYQSSPSPEQAACSMYVPTVNHQAQFYGNRFMPYQHSSSMSNSTPQHFPYYAATHFQQQRLPQHRQLSPDEQEKRILRRERNKLAALRCRTRRRERIEILEKETSNLEGQNKSIEDEIAALRKEMNDLQDILVTHNCVMHSNNNKIKKESTK